MNSSTTSIISNFADFVSSHTQEEQQEMVFALLEKIAENDTTTMFNPTYENDYENKTNSSWSGYGQKDETNLMDLAEELKLVPKKNIIAALSVKNGVVYFGSDTLFITFNKANKGKLEFSYIANDKREPIQFGGQFQTLFTMHVLHLLGAKSEYLSTEKFSDGKAFQRWTVQVNVPKLVSIDENDNYVFSHEEMNLETCIIEENNCSWTSKSRRKESYYKALREQNNVSTSDMLTAKAQSKMMSVMESGKDGIYDANGNLEMQHDAVETAVELLINYSPEKLSDKALDVLA